MIETLVAVVIVLIVVGLIVWGVQQAPGNVPPIIRWGIIMVIILIGCLILLRFVPGVGLR